MEWFRAQKSRSCDGADPICHVDVVSAEAVSTLNLFVLFPPVFDDHIFSQAVRLSQFV